LDDGAPHRSNRENEALHALKEALANIPHEKKSFFVHVQRVHPGLVDDAHLEGFLQAEDFHIDLALGRLLRYWEHRFKVFGPDRYALPLTLDGALRDHADSLKAGFITLLPVTDAEGRAILYSDSGAYKFHNPPCEHKIRVWWYLVHVAMENPNVTKKGMN
jgi:hypothetical protein